MSNYFNTYFSTTTIRIEFQIILFDLSSCGCVLCFSPGQQHKALAVKNVKKITFTSTSKFTTSDTINETSEKSSSDPKWTPASTSSDIFRVKWTSIKASSTKELILYLLSKMIASLWGKCHFRELALKDMQFETPIKTIMNIGNTVSIKMNIVYIITVLYRSSSPNNSSEAVENSFLKRTKLFCLNTLKINW